jgi:hypothetical protein
MEAHDQAVAFLVVDGFIAILDSYEEYVIKRLREGQSDAA